MDLRYAMTLTVDIRALPNREMLAEELRAVFGAAQAMAEKISEETGYKYKVEEPRLIS
jgi:hypothetical protein